VRRLVSSALVLEGREAVFVSLARFTASVGLTKAERVRTGLWIAAFATPLSRSTAVSAST